MRSEDKKAAAPKAPDNKAAAPKVKMTPDRAKELGLDPAPYGKAK